MSDKIKVKLPWELNLAIPQTVVGPVTDSDKTTNCSFTCAGPGNPQYSNINRNRQL